MKNKKHKFLLVLAVAGLAAAFVLGFIIFDALVLEPNWITVRKVTIKDPALARALAGVTIAQISDLHLQGNLGFREKCLIKKLNCLQPDLIVITGDLVEEAAGPLVVKFLRQLKPKLWCYGIRGNSDFAYLKTPGYSRAWEGAGLSLIGGRSLKMELGKAGSPFWLAGIDYPGDQPGDIVSRVSGVFKDIPPAAPVIFLSYSPDLAPLLIERGANLVLSGDTHGGQVSFPGWSKIFQEFGRSPFIRGLYRLGNSHLYVNRGIATKVFPARFLCPPEITVFRFRS